MTHLILNYKCNNLKSLLYVLGSIFTRYKKSSEITLHIFSEDELVRFVQKIEKRVYNNIACVKTKGNC